VVLTAGCALAELGFTYFSPWPLVARLGHWTRREEYPVGRGRFIYLPAIELEEQHLRTLFPNFEAYAERVPALWPRLAHATAPERFRWDLYVRNREYQALVGFLFGTVYLIVRARYIHEQ
jgi:hypothetical protein